MRKTRMNLIGLVVALVMTGCAVAQPWHGPSSHDAAGLKALFTDRVEVLHRPGSDKVRIVANNGSMGHYCDPHAFGHSYFVEGWTTRVRTNGYRAVITPIDKPTGQLVQYNAVTGRIATTARRPVTSWIGHLQDTIPAVTWSLCPDFPLPGELGFRLNPGQTADTYKALVAQDPEAILKGL